MSKSSHIVFTKQRDSMDCGPTCLHMVSGYYGKHYSIQTLRKRCHITREGVSLLGISEAAESIGFRATGVKITWEQLRDEMPLPCIVHWNQKHFIVVHEIRTRRGKSMVKVADPASGLLEYGSDAFCRGWLKSDDDDQNGKRRMEIGEFRDRWTGAVLVLEKGAESCEPDIESHVREERNERLKRMVLVISAGMMLILAVCRLTSIYGIGEWLLLGLNIIAAAVCGLLLEKQIQGKSGIGDKVCLVFRGKRCSSILDSAIAKPFLSISWSEIGLGFFMTNMLLMLSVPAMIHVLVMLAFLSLFVSIWSIAYQTIRKNWCPLCVLVQICVIMQSAVIISFGMIDIPSLGHNILWSLVLYPTAIIALHYEVKVHEIRNKEHSDLRRFRRIITDPDVFEYLLKQQTHYEVSERDSSIIIGNTDAPNMITLFSNPHCAPCSEVHGMISNLLKRTQAFRVQYIFTAFNREQSGDSMFLISCYNRHRDSFADILDEWFEKGKDNPKHFIRSHGGFHSDDSLEEQYAKHLNWANTNDIMVTPTILLNGYELPYGYSIGDLYYIDL